MLPRFFTPVLMTAIVVGFRSYMPIAAFIGALAGIVLFFLGSLVRDFFKKRPRYFSRKRRKISN
jgi:hypothetical protein